jgi:hypothetical protein
MNRRIAHAAQIGALVLALALVPAALAAKGGSGGGGTHGGNGTTGGSSSLSLVMVSDVNTPGVSYGDQVTFNVSTSASYPSVELDCYQGSTLVYSHIAGFYPSFGWSQDYTLGSSYWTGGAADCTATLYYTTKNGTNSTLGTLTFHANA